MHVSVIWQMLQNLVVLADFLKDVMNCETFILWTCQELDIITLNEELLLGAEV